MVIAPALIGILVGVTMPQRTPPSPRSTQVSADGTFEYRDFSAAMRAADAAHRRAARDGRWEPLIEVGDAYSRIAVQAGAPGTAGERARDAYRGALRNARRAESLDGVLRAAEGFAQIGDAAEVELSLQIARALAGSDAEAIADVKGASARLSELRQGSHDSN